MLSRPCRERRPSAGEDGGLSDATDCSLPGSSVRGIFQAKVPVLASFSPLGSSGSPPGSSVHASTRGAMGRGAHSIPGGSRTQRGDKVMSLLFNMLSRPLKMSNNQVVRWGHRPKPCDEGKAASGTGRPRLEHRLGPPGSASSRTGQAPAGSVLGPGSSSSGVLSVPCFMTTELDAWGWCTGTPQRDGVRREEGGGFRMGNTCIPVARHRFL